MTIAIDTPGAVEEHRPQRPAPPDPRLLFAAPRATAEDIITPEAGDDARARWHARRGHAKDEALDAIAYAIRTLAAVHGLHNTLGPAGALARVTRLADAEVVLGVAERGR